MTVTPCINLSELRRIGHEEERAALKDPSGIFNSSLDGKTRRAIDFHEGERIDEEALKALVGAAVTLNQSAAKN